MTDWRKELISQANNPENPNKNICTLAIAEALGVHNSTKYLHTMADLVRAIRSRFKVRDTRKAYFGECVSNVRKELKERSTDNTLGYVAFVFERDWELQTGHVIFLNRDGKTLVDTCEAFWGFDSRRVICLAEVSGVRK